MLDNWGLGYNIGFNKELYKAQLVPVSPTLNVYSVKSVNIAQIEIYNTIYMEIETFNWIDEKKPYYISANNFDNNFFNGV